ncbi:MAG: hypothetical protein L7S56_06410 [Candidatus Poseidonia sp.]|nr:hypothetical protein [Poseidonia sp.]
MAKIHCLGSGLVGAFVIRHLVKSGHEVHAYDLHPMKHAGAHLHVGDVFQALNNLEEGLIVNMLPGTIGGDCTQRLITEGRNVVDLSFADPTPDLLDSLAKESGSVIIWDVGIAPGLSNMLLRKAQNELGHLDLAEIRVGGNPVSSDESWSYMAPFSPIDVIAEYTRPARVVRGGTMAVLPALAERHIIEVANKGPMEAFLSDGLRSLIHGINAENMSEYTVRWPGHIQKYIDLRDSDGLDIDALLNQWKLDPNRDEFTWMEITATSPTGSRRWTVQDHGMNHDSSMARTTGLVTVATALTLLENEVNLPPGVHAPEDLPEVFLSRTIELFQSEGVEIQAFHE